ncbi:MAG TPA: DUF1015 domain-containing protein [Ktedonobacteraceae bacterium]|nr:DUF1015 domain-containing protein [Ktedonobacteraceae bacterium]
MAEVQPLRGIRYNREAVGDLAQVVTPPFDVISSKAQEAYYARSPYNVIRLELTKGEPGDHGLNTRYTRAAATYGEWRYNGVLGQDERPAFYLYQQRFMHGGQTYTRTSLLARVRLEPWSAKVVLPHERTLSKPKDDRLHLLQATATQFSPLMTLYEDPQGRIRRLLSRYAAQPEVTITDEAQEQHLLQPITDEEQITLIQDFFAERQLFIADGHHRYETALNYRREVRERLKDAADTEDAANYVMMALVDIDDPGMLVLPTHRLLHGLSEQALSQLTRQNLEQYFAVQELGLTVDGEALLKQLAQSGQQAPSLVLRTPEQTWLLSLNEQGRGHVAQSGHAPAWNELDVAVAHKLVLEALLGLSEADITAGQNVYYVHDAEEALQAVTRDEAQAALLLNATRVRQISEVAKADELMPQKSTYFYPKLITGLVMNPLW